MGFEARISIPEGVSAELQGAELTAKGPKGEVRKSFPSKKISMQKNESEIIVSGKTESKRDKKIVNTIQAHIKNMFRGAKDGFEYRLAMVYSHFPITVTKKDGFVEVTNLFGSKKPKRARIIGKASVNIKGKQVTVSGADREEVGQTAANIEAVSRLTGKDRRKFQDGIYVVSKDD